MIISDIDDCLINTKQSIFNSGYTLQEFYFSDVSESEQMRVYRSAELTSWGVEFLDLAKHYDVMLLSANHLPPSFLSSLFGIDESLVINKTPNIEKAILLNSLERPFLYVDDITTVIDSVDNEHGLCFNFPVRIGRRRKRKFNGR